MITKITLTCDECKGPDALELEGEFFSVAAINRAAREWGWYIDDENFIRVACEGCMEKHSKAVNEFIRSPLTSWRTSK